MKPVTKITLLAMCAAMLCLSPAFAWAQEPLKCTVTMNTINFGNIDVWRDMPQITATGRVECNRTPKYYMDVYFDMGNNSDGEWRRMKRYNPPSDDKIYYGLYDENGNYLWDSPAGATKIQLTDECFRGYIFCNFKITGKVKYFSPHPDFYAGFYSDQPRVRLRYWSEY